MAQMLFFLPALSLTALFGLYGAHLELMYVNAFTMRSVLHYFFEPATCSQHITNGFNNIRT